MKNSKNIIPLIYITACILISVVSGALYNKPIVKTDASTSATSATKSIIRTVSPPAQ